MSADDPRHNQPSFSLVIRRKSCALYAAVQADLLLVLGTSLQVAPVSRILQFIPGHVPQVRPFCQPVSASVSEVDGVLLGVRAHAIDCFDVVR